MAIRFLITALAIVALMASSLAYASDPSPLQDYCVAVNNPTGPDALLKNGKICKNPKMVTADDFYYSGLNVAGNTNNSVGSKVTQVTADQICGLNTLGVSTYRIDYAVSGLNPPHIHPRATEILTMMDGMLYVGFVNAKNKLFSKTLFPGDVFVFPKGLIHFQINVGKTKAVAYSALSSQNPGTITIADALIGSEPSIAANVLTKSFQVDTQVIKRLQGQYGMNKN